MNENEFVDYDKALAYASNLSFTTPKEHYVWVARCNGMYHVLAGFTLPIWFQPVHTIQGQA